MQKPFEAMATIIKPKFLRERENIPPPVPDGKAGPDPPPPMQTASIIQADGETGANEATGGANDYFTLQWFVTEGQRWFARSMVKDAKDYYPAFIASYRPTLRRVGINEIELRKALILIA